MKQRYTATPIEEPKQIDRSNSENGLMNINNQLGVDSNVGKVKESAKESNVEMYARYIRSSWVPSRSRVFASTTSQIFSLAISARTGR